MPPDRRDSGVVCQEEGGGMEGRGGDEEGEAGPAPGPSAWVPYLAERAYYDVNSPGKLKNDITSQCLVKIY